MLRLELLVIAMEQKALAERQERLYWRHNLQNAGERTMRHLTVSLHFWQRWNASYEAPEAEVSLQEMWKDIWRDEGRKRTSLSS